MNKLFIVIFLVAGMTSSVFSTNHLQELYQDNFRYYKGFSCSDKNVTLSKEMKKVSNKKDNTKSIYLEACQLKRKNTQEALTDAFLLLKKAANRGDSEAQHDLAVMLETGQGCSENLQEAIKWFQKSAENNYAPAQNVMGSMYELGNSEISPDLLEAMEWYKKAYSQGYSLAWANIERLLEENKE